MNTRIRFFLATLVLFAASIGAYAQPGSAAMAAVITGVKGSGTVTVNNESKPASIGLELPSGAEVAAEGGGISIVFAQGDLFDLSQGERLTLGADMQSSKLTAAGGTRGLNASEGIEVASNGLGANANQEKQVKLADIVSLRAEAGVVSVSPRLGVAQANPTFYWFDTDESAKGSERNYILYVRDKDGKQIVRQELKGKVGELNKYQVAGLPAVPEARYSWGIMERSKPLGENAPLPAMFVFVDNEGIQKADQQEKRLESLFSSQKIDAMNYHTLMSLFYLDERERLFSDAFPHLVALTEMPEARGFAYKQIAMLLNRFGNQVAGVAAHFAEKAVKGS